MKKGTILYVNRSLFDNSASGYRTLMMAKAIRNIGYNVVFISNLPANSSLNPKFNRIETLNRYKDDELLDFQNFIYAVPLQNVAGFKNKFKEFFHGDITYDRVVCYCSIFNPVGIILYNDPLPVTSRLVSFCRYNNIKLIADVTEWYQRDISKSLQSFLLACLVDYRIKNIDDKLDGTIVISDYLLKYYKKKRRNAIRIPPLMEFEENIKPSIYSSDRPLKICYAGFPGKKDVLFSFIEAVRRINTENIRIQLDVVGVDPIDIKKTQSETLGIIFHGRKEHNQTLTIVRNSDFGILFRKNRRYAKAGFSTKLAECLSLGVPIICNKVGGSDNVIKTGVNGVLMESTSVNQMEKILQELLVLSDDEINKMKKNAMDSSMDFKIKSHKHELTEFLSEL